jgi:hypothetical protein
MKKPLPNKTLSLVVTASLIAVWAQWLALSSVSIFLFVNVAQLPDTASVKDFDLINQDFNDGFIYFAPFVFLGQFMTPVLIVCFLWWFKSTYHNFIVMCQSQDLEHSGESELWSVLGWFVPIANLVIPYRIMNRSYQRVQPKKSWLVKLWWLAVIALPVSHFAAPLLAPFLFSQSNQLIYSTFSACFSVWIFSASFSLLGLTTLEILKDFRSEEKRQADGGGKKMMGAIV